MVNGADLERQTKMNLLRYASSRALMMCCSLFLLACNPMASGNTTTPKTVYPPEVGDGGFLSGQPCGPPCFWSIVPGVTTEAEAEQVLQAAGLFEKCEAYNTEVESGTRGISCRFGVGISFQEGGDIVNGIGFRPSQRITVEDAIGRYGEPDAVLVSAIGIPEEPYTMMSLYYGAIKAKLRLPEQEGTTFSVEAPTEIENISYSSRISYDHSADSLKKFLQKWNGYGKYQRLPE